MLEIWRKLIYNGEDYGDYYLVSNFGRIKNAKTEHVRKPFCNHGYYYLVLGAKCNSKTIIVHRAVAQAFVPNPDDLPQVNHKDGNKLNNNIDNLEWVTAKDNCIHAVINDLSASGERSELSKLNEEQINYIKNFCIPYDNEFGCASLARKFNVSSTTISKIIHNASWKEYSDDYELIPNEVNISYRKDNKCKGCGESFKPAFNGQLYCSEKCLVESRRKVERPSKEELFELIKTTTFVEIGKKYGVSDNAVRKWCKSYDIPYKKKDIKKIIHT